MALTHTQFQLKTSFVIPIRHTWFVTNFSDQSRRFKITFSLVVWVVTYLFARRYLGQSEWESVFLATLVVVSSFLFGDR